MNKKEIMDLTDEELRIKAAELFGVDMEWLLTWEDKTRGLSEEHIPNYPEDICAAMHALFPSVYGRGGKIKGGAWVLSTVDGGRDVASACLVWKAKSAHKHRANKVKVVLERGKMARAITLCWVCGMLGVSDV